MKVRCIKDLPVPRPIGSIKDGIAISGWIKGQNYHFQYNPNKGYFVNIGISKPIYLGPYVESVFNEHFLTLEQYRNNIINTLI